MFIFAEPILKILFPTQSAGTVLLQVSSLTIIFAVLAQTINGALQGLGKTMVPALAFAVGVFAKFILNITLVPIPQIGVNGAAIGSVACNLIACMIGFSVLKKNIDISFPFSKYILKPFVATFIMGVCSYAIYILLLKVVALRIAGLIGMALAIIIYALAVIRLKIFTKEEIYMIPYGTKIYKFLVNTGIYKDKEMI